MQASFLAFACFYYTTKAYKYENLAYLKLITCCVEALYAVNTPLWQPGEETQMSQTRLTNQPTAITRWPQRGFELINRSDYQWLCDHVPCYS